MVIILSIKKVTHKKTDRILQLVFHFDQKK